MTIVDQVRSISALGLEFQEYRRDVITLTWEDRRQGHGRRRSDTGVEFGISLPGGTVLKNGDGLILDAEKIIVEVKEAKEPVYVIQPESSREWAYFAYQVGNRHQSLMIGDHELIFLQSPAIRSLLEQLGVQYATDVRPFTAALAQIGHHHE